MKKRILCFGDSNTWGYIPGSAKRYNEEDRWTGLLGEKLGPDYKIIEEGMTGRTTVFDTGFDDYLNGKKALGYILKSQLPLDCVVMMLGTNDLCEHHMDRIELGITELIRILKNAGYIYRTKMDIYRSSDVKLLLISPLPYGDRTSLNDSIKEESKLYPSVYKRVAENTGVYFLDPSPFIKPSDIDGIHFDKETHKIFSELVYKKILEMGI